VYELTLLRSCELVVRQGLVSSLTIVATIMINLGEIEGLTRRILLKPDMMVITNTRMVLLEVSVVYELHREGEVASLRGVRRDKMNKYEITKRVLAARFGKPVYIRTLIVVCRGGWMATNNKLFKELGVSFSVLDRNAFVGRAFWGSILTFNRFLHHTKEPLFERLVRID